jgi:hypothetical protein
MFYEHEIRYRKLSVILSDFVIHFILLLYINCIIVIQYLMMVTAVI